MGVAVWVSPGVGTPEDWHRKIAFWNGAGLTHVTAHTPMWADTTSASSAAVPRITWRPSPDFGKRCRTYH